MIKMIVALSLTLAVTAQANPADDEIVTNVYRDALLARKPLTLIPGLLGPRHAKLALDAIESAQGAGVPVTSVIPSFAWSALPPREMVRWFRLGGIAQESALIEQIANAPAEPGLLYELLGVETKLKTAGARALVQRLETTLPNEARAFRAAASAAGGKVFTPPSAAELRSLYEELPDIAHYANGAYAGKPRLFVFCRHNRRYPCLLTLKDKDDRPVREGPALWTQPTLALSGYGRPYNQSQGNTPQGVQLVNGVMPTASEPYSYGKFRRMILEFPKKSANETEMKRLLPASVANAEWWKESYIARDVGRGELRIHGTGQRNNMPSLPYYPFIPTVGCLTQREMKYGETDYVDQRRVLDRVMKAQGLDPVYANEPSIKALVYVVDIDDKQAAVTADDLARLGIK